MNRRAFGLLALSVGLAFQVKADRFPYGAKVVAIEDLTPDTKRISFRLVDGEKFQFIPGQYVFLKVPEEYVKRWNERYKTTHDEVARPYSFAGSPRRLPTFDLIIKLAGAPPGKDVPPGLASTYVHTQLKVGDMVHFSEPIGNLRLSEDSGRPIVIVAGGTGAAPFVSLLECRFESQLEWNNAGSTAGPPRLPARCSAVRGRRHDAQSVDLAQHLLRASLSFRDSESRALMR